MNKTKEERKLIYEVKIKLLRGEKLTLEEYKTACKHGIINSTIGDMDGANAEEIANAYNQFCTVNFYDDGKSKGYLCTHCPVIKENGKIVACEWGIHHWFVDKSKLRPDQLRLFLDVGFNDFEVGWSYDKGKNFEKYDFIRKQAEKAIEARLIGEKIFNEFFLQEMDQLRDRLENEDVDKPALEQILIDEMRKLLERNKIKKIDCRILILFLVDSLTRTFQLKDKGD
jgi:hypothetical protein